MNYAITTVNLAISTHLKNGHSESVQLGIFEISGFDVHSSVYST